MTATPLGPGSEFDRIRAIAAAMGQGAAGLGDDCAFLDGWCASIDVSTEGVHFRRAWLEPEEIGWRSAMASLSDLAAVGAEPVGVLVGLSSLRDEPVGTLTAVMSGVASAAQSVGAAVMGGDLTAGPGLSLAVTVLGRTDQPIRRCGARVGDGVWVTGALGGARSALEAWLAGAEPSPGARARFARPHARVSEARVLRRHGATALIDLSDGLGGDAGHLARASGVGLVIEIELLPVDPAVGGADRILTAAGGGEDYELLVTLPPAFDERAQAAFRAETGTAITRIGEVGPGDAPIFLRDGAPIALAGYDHFR